MIPRVHMMISAVLILAGAGFGAAMYSRLPDPSPTHWNIHGVADGFGPRWELAFGVPVVLAGLMVVLAFLPLLGPFRSNFERFRVVYGRVCVTVAVAMVAMHVVMVLKAAGREIHVGSAFSIIFGVLFAVLGNWMGKLRRNMYVGIRTPWTIANDVVWERTHRIGGRIMMACGGVIAIAGLMGLGDTACFAVVMSSIGALVAWSFVYSYVIYRRVGAVDELPAIDR